MRQPPFQSLQLRSPSDGRDAPMHAPFGVGQGGGGGGFYRIDSMEIYPDGQNLNLLDRGDSPLSAYGFAGGYVDRLGHFGLKALDTVEGYTDGADVDALNGGSDWPGPYVDRLAILGLKAQDNLESYTDAAAVNGLNAGSGWSGAYVDR